jgi:hypothetical protein
MSTSGAPDAAHSLPRPVKRRKVDTPSSPVAGSDNSSPSMRRTVSIGAIPHLLKPIQTPQNSPTSSTRDPSSLPSTANISRSLKASTYFMRPKDAISSPVSGLPSPHKASTSKPAMVQNSNAIPVELDDPYIVNPPTSSAESLSRNGSPVEPQSSSTPIPSVSVKREPSSSPPLLPTRYLTTSGSKRYHPIPSDCVNSHPGYTENRKIWREKEVEALRKMNLSVTRCLVRGDGMVIDWYVFFCEGDNCSAGQVNYLYGLIHSGQKSRKHGYNLAVRIWQKRLSVYIKPMS